MILFFGPGAYGWFLTNAFSILRCFLVSSAAPFWCFFSCKLNMFRTFGQNRFWRLGKKESNRIFFNKIAGEILSYTTSEFFTTALSSPILSFLALPTLTFHDDGLDIELWFHRCEHHQKNNKHFLVGYDIILAQKVFGSNYEYNDGLVTFSTRWVSKRRIWEIRDETRDENDQKSRRESIFTIFRERDENQPISRISRSRATLIFV